MTLADVKKIVDEENLEASQTASEQENSVPIISPCRVWSNNHVTNYGGGDCTNFASQALRTRGAKGGVTGYLGYIDRSSKRTSQGLKYSAAWINTDVFRQYWEVKGRSVRRYSKAVVENEYKEFLTVGRPVILTFYQEISDRVLKDYSEDYKKDLIVLSSDIRTKLFSGSLSPSSLYKDSKEIILGLNLTLSK
ncbi:amidase domain-containing protein [Enterococcus haemoperoxidus]|nr:amidase domain-containing protein [Enterococcus haemoperoxidus]OJG54462.1 hypothetical protein RV06_GL002805 [Enterococcus haemoperoxidus]